MPNRDGTGPEGKGPMTGRRLGSCKCDGTSVRRRDGSFRGPGKGRGYVGRDLDDD